MIIYLFIVISGQQKGLRRLKNENEFIYFKLCDGANAGLNILLVRWWEGVTLVIYFLLLQSNKYDN